MSDANKDTSSELQACKHCGSSTGKRCSGCAGAPAHGEQAATPTFYCDIECQKADWHRHKTECRKLQARNSLSRAAELLQSIFYKIRMQATTLPFTSVHVENNTIHLKADTAGSYSDQQIGPFPVHLFQDSAIAESALMYFSSMDAMVYLYSFAAELLPSICYEVKEVLVSGVKSKLDFHHGPVGARKSNSPYLNVYKVVLKQGETWAIDPTGAQFGYHEPLCSWKTFQQRVTSVEKSLEFGSLRNKVFFCEGAKTPLKFVLSQLMETEQLVKIIEDWFSLSVKQKYNGNFKSILKEPEAKFLSSKQEFLAQLSAHVKNSVARLYVPAEIAKRTKEVDARVARNQADPTIQKDFEGFERFVRATIGRTTL